MIVFAKPYSFQHMLGQGVVPGVNPPATVPPVPPASIPAGSSSGTVRMMGYDVPVLALTIATAALVGAIWVTTRSIAALGRR